VILNKRTKELSCCLKRRLIPFRLGAASEVNRKGAAGTNQNELEFSSKTEENNLIQNKPIGKVKQTGNRGG